MPSVSSGGSGYDVVADVDADWDLASLPSVSSGGSRELIDDMFISSNDKEAHLDEMQEIPTDIELGPPGEIQDLSQPTYYNSCLHSLAHNDFQAGNIVYFSLDLEHAGEYVGVIQLLAMSLDQEGNELGEFNSYVKPTCMLESKWVLEGNNIRPTKERIKNANVIVYVFKALVEFIESFLDNASKKGIVVAWNGKTYDLNWLYFLTEDLRYKDDHSMHRWCPYFCDPMEIIKHYTGCKINLKHSKIQGLSLEAVWCFVNSSLELAGAHDLLVDARAQASVLFDSRMKLYIDKTISVGTFEEIWASKRKKDSTFLKNFDENLL